MADDVAQAREVEPWGERVVLPEPETGLVPFRTGKDARQETIHSHRRSRLVDGVGDECEGGERGLRPRFRIAPASSHHDHQGEGPEHRDREEEARPPVRRAVPRVPVRVGHDEEEGEDRPEREEGVAASFFLAPRGEGKEQRRGDEKEEPACRSCEHPEETVDKGRREALPRVAEIEGRPTAEDVLAEYEEEAQTGPCRCKEE